MPLLSHIRAPLPAQTLLAALFLCFFASALVIWQALQPPWLGLHLQPDMADLSQPSQPGLFAQAIPGGPAASLGPSARLLSLRAAAGSSTLHLQADDLIEEPDFFDSYAQMATFFARQTQLHQLLQSPVQLIWQTENGQLQQTLVTPTRRPLSSLPITLWFQLTVGSLGFLIACWVWVLRPHDLGARMFALTGVMFPVFAFPAALYSSRELALDGTLFRFLSSLNHTGAMLFGCALVALFLCYPRVLVQPRTLLIIPAIFGSWLLTDILRLAPDQNWGSRLPILLEMLLAIALAVVQWQRSKGHPSDRAALRWLSLFTLIGSGLFVFTTVASSLLDLLPPLPQGYAFGFFLLIYIGLALGLRRYRLFDLDEWAWRILAWVGGGIAVVLLDAALIAGLQMNPTMSLGLTLLLCGWLYFPMRQWLWQRLSGARDSSVEQAFPDIIRIAVSPSPREQESRWDALLHRIFQPLELSRAVPAPHADHISTTAPPSLSDEGQMLHVPACGNLAPRTLRLASHGRRLFSTRDLSFVQALCQLINQAASGVDAYARGVSEERRRIARDMHDDIGARLLMLIHRASDEPTADLARAAMRDLRATLNALEARHTPLEDALADWRADLATRCEAGGVAFAWQAKVLPDCVLTPRETATLEKVLREALTNALKHARPSRVEIRVSHNEAGLHLHLHNDNLATHADAQNTPLIETTSNTSQEGRGLRNMRNRLAELGGYCDVDTQPQGSCVKVLLPLAGMAAHNPSP